MMVVQSTTATKMALMMRTTGVRILPERLAAGDAREIR